METPPQTEPQKSNKGLIITVIIIAVVVVILCLFPVIVIAALTIMGPLVGKVFSTINSSLSTPSPY